jgi:hypothetical protein
LRNKKNGNWSTLLENRCQASQDGSCYASANLCTFFIYLNLLFFLGFYTQHCLLSEYLEQDCSNHLACSSHTSSIRWVQDTGKDLTNGISIFQSICDMIPGYRSNRFPYQMSWMQYWCAVLLLHRPLWVFIHLV